MNKITIFRVSNGYIVKPEPDRPYPSPFLAMMGMPAKDVTEEDEPEDLTFIAKTWGEAVEIAERELAGMEVPAVFRE
jgi:hypothetical protein